MTSLYSIASFKVGDRVELAPFMDRWMRGDRFGAITRIGRKKLGVKLDRSGQTITVSPIGIGGIV